MKIIISQAHSNSVAYVLIHNPEAFKKNATCLIGNHMSLENAEKIAEELKRTIPNSEIERVTEFHG